MEQLSSKETRLIKTFLTEFKNMLKEEGVPFNPKSLTMVSQPDVTINNRFDYISYNKWFDELDMEAYIGTSDNLIQSYLEVPINILISAEEVGKPLLSKKDQRKLVKALKLLQEITVERQK